MNELWKQYVHPNWDDIADFRRDKYYFVKLPDDIEEKFSEIQYQLEIEVPGALREFYQNWGYGFLLFNQREKKGIYRVLSPEEILDLYFEPEVEGGLDDFITYRENAWEKLDGNRLLAFCLFGEEDSLLYIGVEDGAIYYVSLANKIANSLDEFLNLLDQEADYFLK